MLYATVSVHHGVDQNPLSLPPPSDCLPQEETTKEPSPEETVQLLIPPIEKRRWVRCSKKPVFKRRRRLACLILVLLVLLIVGGLLFLKNPGLVDSEPMEQLVSLVISQVSEEIAEDPADEEALQEEPSTDQASGEEPVEEEEGEGPAVPDDPTLYLTIPRLGMYDNTVRNDSSEEALDLGAIKLPYTGFPWQEGDTNTYIACHRLGWPGTESYNQCLNLPAMQEGDQIFLKDANDTLYRYQVVETLVVEANDTWVTEPVAGKDMLSLQTCVEAPDELYTLGPDWSYRFIVRAERTDEGQSGGFKRLGDDLVIAHAGLLHKSLSYYDRIIRDAKRGVAILGKVAPVLPRVEAPKLFKGIL